MNSQVICVFIFSKLFFQPNRKIATLTMMGRFGSPRWVVPTSISDQKLMYALDDALWSFLAEAVNVMSVVEFWCEDGEDCLIQIS